MIPNPDIWGAPSSWETSAMPDIGSYNGYIEGKFCPFNLSEHTSSSARYTISSGVTAGKLTPGEPFDTSCCPWRMKGDSYFLSLQKLWFPDAYTANHSPLFTEGVKARGVPIMISTLPTNSSQPKMTELSGIWEPDPSAPGSTPIYSTAPLLQFNYLKIFLHAKICCSAYNDTEPGDTRVYGVDDYFDNQFGLYPYIRGLMFDVYVWAGDRWTMINYSLFNIIPVNAYIQGFSAGSIDILSNNFSVFRDGINGKAIGRQSDKNDGVIFQDSYIDAAEAQSYYKQESSTQASVCYVAMPEDWDINVFTRWGIHYAAPYKQGLTKQWVLSQFATLGFWFYTGYSPLQCNTSDPDDHTYIPLFDDYGTTTGEYLSGAAALTAPAAQWRNDVFERDVYHGEPPYDPTNYDPDNKTVFPSSGAWTISEGFYGIPYWQLQPALEYLYTWARSQQEIDSIKQFLVTDPIDVVHSLTLFPVNVVPNDLTPPYDIYNAIFPNATIVNIKFGNVESNIQAFRIPYRSGIIDLGYIDVFETFESFLDYSPYTSIMIYLPFCGFQALDCDKYMGHKINIKYVVDIATGACTALLLRDNLVCDSINGQMGVTIPLTGLQASQVQAAIDSSMLQYKQRTRETAVGLASLTAGAAGAAIGGNPLALGGSILGAVNLASKYASAGENLEYNLSHIHTPFATVGTATSAAAGNMELTPRLYISRPKLLDSYVPEIYGHTVGFSCLLNVELSQVSGFTRCASADLSGIQATAQEKQQLLRLLQSGVYI